jgi:hypothetical protein
MSQDNMWAKGTSPEETPKPAAKKPAAKIAPAKKAPAKKAEATEAAPKVKAVKEVKKVIVEEVKELTKDIVIPDAIVKAFIPEPTKKEVSLSELEFYFKDRAIHYSAKYPINVIEISGKDYMDRNAIVEIEGNTYKLSNVIFFKNTLQTYTNNIIVFKESKKGKTTLELIND